MSFKSISRVVPSNFFITDKFLKNLKIDYLMHGNDNKNKISKTKMKILREPWALVVH